MHHRAAFATVAATFAAALAACLAACVSDDSGTPLECANGCADSGLSFDGAQPAFDSGSAPDVTVVADTGTGSNVDATVDSGHAPTDAGADTNEPLDAPVTQDASDGSPSAADASDGSADASDGSADASDAATTLDASDAGPGVPEAGVAVILVSGQNTPLRIATGAGLVYWSTSGDSSLWREPTTSAPGDGGAATHIAYAPASPIVAMITDATNAYFATTAGDVFQVAHASTTAIPLASGQPNISQMTTDATFLYWVVDNPTGSVGRAPIGGPAELPDAAAFSGTLDDPRGITLAGGKVYFTLGTGNTSIDEIGTLNPDGGAPLSVLAGEYYPLQIFNDGTYLYWSEDDPTSNPASIYRAKLDGTGVTLFSNSAIHPILFLDTQYLYTVSATEGVIIAFDTLANGAVHLPYKFTYATGGLTADGTSLYWTDVNGGNVWMGPK